MRAEFVFGRTSTVNGILHRVGVLPSGAFYRMVLARRRDGNKGGCYCRATGIAALDSIPTSITLKSKLRNLSAGKSK